MTHSTGSIEIPSAIDFRIVIVVVIVLVVLDDSSHLVWPRVTTQKSRRELFLFLFVGAAGFRIPESMSMAVVFPFRGLFFLFESWVLKSLAF